MDDFMEWTRFSLPDVNIEGMMLATNLRKSEIENAFRPIFSNPDQLSTRGYLAVRTLSEVGSWSELIGDLRDERMDTFTRYLYIRRIASFFMRYPVRPAPAA